MGGSSSSSTTFDRANRASAQDSARADSSTNGARRKQHILASLDGVTVPSIRPSAPYRLAITALAAALMIVLAIFVTMLAFLVWLVAWHAYQTVQTIGEGPYFMFHLPMAILGGVLLVFTLKPLFSRGKSRWSPQITLKREDEPTLFAFVEKLCQSMGAHMPANIIVDCQPNAAAQRRGLFAGRRKLELVIGLPLAASLPVNQFAGVLAHEFGHFKQHAGMAGTNFVYRLMHLLAAIVFRRGKLDQRLAALRRSREGPKRLIFWLLFLPIESGRGVLWLMMMICQVITCGASRRMEYTADESEAYVCGTRGFERTGKLLFFLGIANARASHELSEAWNERRLADDWVALIVAHARQLAEHRDDILKALEQEKSHWYSTHPSFTQRLDHVRSLQLPGLLNCDASSKHLFSDFEGLCRRASAAAYRSVVGSNFDQAKLVPTASLETEGIENRASMKALRRFLRDVILRLRPIIPETRCAMPPENIPDTFTRLGKAREQMLERADAALRHAEPLWQNAADAATVRARINLCDLPRVSLALRRAGNRWKTRLAVIEGEERTLLQTLLLFEPPARERLTLGLSLLHDNAIAAKAAALKLDAPAVAGKPGSTPPAAPQSATDMQYDAMRLLDVCWALEPHVATVRRLRDLSVKLNLFDSSIVRDRPFAPLVDGVFATSQQMFNLLTQLSKSLSDVAYPFDHAVQSVSVANALIAKMPENSRAVGHVYNTASTAANRFDALLFRVLSKLSEYAERVEIAVGLPALPDPPAREASAADKQAAEAEVRRRARSSRAYWLGYGARAAGGVVMFTVLVLLSLFPPSLPDLGSNQGQPFRYQPAAFHVSLDRHDIPGPTILQQSPRMVYPQNFGPNRVNNTPPAPAYHPPIYNPPTDNPAPNPSPNRVPPPPAPHYPPPAIPRPVAPRPFVPSYHPPAGGGRR